MIARKREARKPRWKGLLSEASPIIRAMAFIVLVLGTFALTFVQLGFVSIEPGGQDTAHLVVLLQPIALTALLFGVRYSTLLGFLSGSVLYLHSLYMPLDYYELTFISPVSSIVMLTLVGLLLGTLFPFVLRNNPGRVKRVIYITIVCIVVSWVYSSAFFVNAVVSLIASLASNKTVLALSEAEQNTAVEEHVFEMLTRMGSISLQARVDALLMACLCLLAEFAVPRLLRLRESATLRTVFTSWLVVVVQIAFMVAMVIGFISVTLSERNSADDEMRDEIDYLVNQIGGVEKTTNTVADILSASGLSEDEIANLDLNDNVRKLSVGNLLEGYSTTQDGLLMILTGDDTILQSDSPGFTPGTSLQDCFDAETVKAIDEAIQTNKMQRIIFDDTGDQSHDTSDLYDRIVNTQIAYLLAGQTGDYTIVFVKPSSLVFARRPGTMARMTGAVCLVLLAVFVLVIRLLRVVIGRPVARINDVLSRITGGDLNARVNERSARELSYLSDGINNTVDALQGWISEAETRMDAELATAKAIQESALPRIFPPYPDILHFDIYASMTPAKEVGGDFYDFFLMGDDAGPDVGKLGFVVADVSGKGVPAALFMMAAKTLIHDYMLSGMELGEAIENVNHQLCTGNDADMFVTVFAGVLDYETGHLQYVNAGHNPPLIWRQGAWEWMKKRSGLPLGIFDDMPYRAHTVDCQIGDQLLIYTDGVTEAMNVNDEQYGEQRLEELAREHFDLHPHQMVNEVRQDVARFAEGAEQSDDITILALEVGVPPEVTATLTVPARVPELARVNEFIHSELDRRLCPMRAQHQLDIAVEELFVNVCLYAYPDAPKDWPGQAHISYSYSADPPSIEVSIADDGVPFDPLAKPDAVTPDDIMDVPIGGLGILMAKRNVDSMRYERVDGSNIVTIVKKW